MGDGDGGCVVAIQFAQPPIIKHQKGRILKIGGPPAGFLKKFATKLVQTGDFPMLPP
jgi:hypothetical protein